MEASESDETRGPASAIAVSLLDGVTVVAALATGISLGC